jgi:hypothetical protein
MPSLRRANAWMVRNLAPVAAMMVVGMTPALECRAQATPSQGGAGQGSGAQGPGQGARPGGFGLGGAGVIGPTGAANLLVILMAPSVQTELKLTDTQKTRLYELTRDAGARSRRIFQAILQPGPDFNPQTVMMAAANLRKESEDSISRLLEAGQKTRFEQIALQVEGAFAIARPEVAKDIRMTPAQNEQVQATLMQWQVAQRQMAVAARNAGGALDNNQSKGLEQNAAQLRKTASQQLARILNGKQKAAFNKLLGEPFDMSELDPSGALKTTASSSGAKPVPEAGSTGTSDDKARTRAGRKSGKPSPPK